MSNNINNNVTINNINKSNKNNNKLNNNKLNNNNNNYNNENNNNLNNIGDLDIIYDDFKKFISKENNNYDIINYFKFIYYDCKTITDNDIDSSDINGVQNKITNKLKNKLENYVNGNKKIQKIKSQKLLKKISENKKSIKSYFKLIDDKLKEIIVMENSKNIKFETNVNFKLKKNIFEINSAFKYKIGELLLRFLFSSCHATVATNLGNTVAVYRNQKDFYENINKSIRYDNNLENNTLYKNIPHFIFLFNYFILIENLFSSELNLNDLFNEKKIKENIQKLYEYYKIGQGKKGKKQDKKGKKQDKKGKKSDKKFKQVLRGRGGGGNNDNDNDNDNDKNSSNDDNKFSSNIKKDDSYKLKDKFLNIIKKINTNEKLLFNDGIKRESTNNLYKYYNYCYKFLLNDYFESKINNCNNTNKHSVSELIKKEIDHPFVQDDIDSKLKIQDIFENKNKTLGELHPKNNKKKRELSIDDQKKKVNSNIDYKYKFNILQLLRTNIKNKDVYLYLKIFNIQFYKSFLLLLRRILITKNEIYSEILDIKSNTNNNITNKISNKNNDLLILINGTKINISKYQTVKNKDIIKKLKLLMKTHKELEITDKNRNGKVLIIQKQIVKLLLELK